MRSTATRLAVIILTGAAILAALVLLGFAGARQYLEPELPDAAELRDIRLQLPLLVYSQDGKLIAQIGEQRRVPVAYDGIPAVVTDAFLASEDDRFFEHPGVDWQGLLRAAIANLSAGGVREGGGTITMQLARNAFLTPEKTLRRKLKEVFLALRIEHEFSKQEILTLYLNRIFLGQRAYGVGAASEVYFGKPVAAVTLPEAALLAGLPRAPSRDNPVANIERARDRRAYVLRRMLELGKIDQAAHDAAVQAPIGRRQHGPTIDLSAPFVAEMARAAMVQRFGDRALTDGYRVTTTVESTLQAAADAAADRAILEYERRHGYRGPAERLGAEAAAVAERREQAFQANPRNGNLLVAIVSRVADRSVTVLFRDGRQGTIEWEGLSWARPALPDDALGPSPKTAGEILATGDVIYLEPLADGKLRLAQIPAVSGALVAVRPHDGAILGLTGGFDFGQSKYNRATQARRQPGSAFKPFLYSAALERGFTPATLVNDAPIVLEGATPDEDWRPQNITRRFYGPTPMREALVRSRNLVSIRLLRGVGTGFATQHITRFGFSRQALPPNLTLALGTGQVTPLEMASGFAVFANGGFQVSPYVIASVSDADGNVVWKTDPPVACLECVTGELAETDPKPANIAPQAISPANAFVMTEMMSDVIQRGTATRAKSLNRLDLAGKTGTTSDRRDTWFVGYNGDVAAAAWIGFDQERSLGEQEEGGKTALPMWIYFMETALKDRPEHRMAEPPGVVRMWVSRSSGSPTSASAPGALFESFLEQYVPQADTYIDTGEGTAAESIEPATGDDSIF
jgi:penicillin-binding protein 1A